MTRFRAPDIKPLRRLLPWALCGVLACGGDARDPGPTEPGGDGNNPGTIGPTEGALEIVTSTTGTPLTPDPWLVTVDDDAPLLMAPNAADTVAPLSPGPHTVRLDPGASHCVPQTGNPQTADVAAGEMMSVRFDVICHPALRLGVSTTGSEPDPDGYDVSIDGDFYGWLPPDGFFIILFHPLLPPGPHTIALSDLEPNCAVSGEHPRTVNIVETEAAIVQLDIVCNPAGTLEVDIATSADPDPDGYVVTLNGGPRRWISAEGGQFEFLTPGDYTVALFDVAPHCNLPGPNTATATLVSGGSAAVAFTVNCGPLQTAPPGRDVLVDANSEIFLLGADGSRFVNLTDDTDQKFDPRWSPDGRKIAFTSGDAELVTDPFPHRRLVSHVFVMNADGGGRTQLTHGEREEGAAWSPDGTRIAYIATSSDNAYLSVMNADGSGQTRLTHVGPSSPFVLGIPAWSPDGTKIAYGTRLSAEHRGIIVANADGSGTTRLTSAPDAGVVWSPDGTRIAFVRFVGVGDQMYVINADGGGLTPLTSDPGDSRHYLSWSPDGTKIAFGLGQNIYLVNGDGTGLTQLTFGPAADLPAWSPDGNRIAYYVYELTQNQLYLMNLDGSGEVPLTPPWGSGRPGSPAAWRP